MANESTLNVKALAVPGGCGAQKVFAGHFASSQELALGPVTHELEASLTLHDHGGGQVPVTAGGGGIGVTLDFAEGFQRLGHRGAGQGLAVELDQRVLVELGTAHAQHHALKGGEVLPVLATVGHGDQACGFLILSAAAKNSS
jgi:hypothetical protein